MTLEPLAVTSSCAKWLQSYVISAEILPELSIFQNPTELRQLLLSPRVSLSYVSIPEAIMRFACIPIKPICCLRKAFE